MNPLSFPTEPAAARSWAFDKTSPLHTYLPLFRSWQRSENILDQLKSRLSDLPLKDAVLTIAVSGSLGRMEFLPNSDVDLIVVAQDDLLNEPQKKDCLVQTLWEAIRELNLPVPKSSGIFSQAVTKTELCDSSTVGKLDESPSLFGKRIQLLLDSQPVWGENEFKQLQSEILTRYQIPPESNDPFDCFYLTNDLLRYQRALAMRYQFQSRDLPLEWRKLNTKFRHSRFINHFGLLLLLGEMTIQPVAKAEWLRKGLSWTPLERIAATFLRHRDSRFHIIMRGYSQFLEWMDDEQFLTDLNTGDHPEENKAFKEVLRNSRILTQEIERFLTERRADWNEDFVHLITY